MSLDVYIYATKRNWYAGGADEDTLVAHCGQVTDDHRHPRTGMPVAGTYQWIGKAVEKLDGMDPKDVLPRIGDMVHKVDPAVRPLVLGFFEQLRNACLHCQRVRVMTRPSMEQRFEDSDGATTVADLYQNDFRIRIRKG